MIKQKKIFYTKRFIIKKLYLKKKIIKKKYKKWWWFLKYKKGRPAGWLKKINFWINLKFYGVQFSFFKKNKNLKNRKLFFSKYYNKFFFEELMQKVSDHYLTTLFTVSLDDEHYQLKLSEYLIDHNFYFTFIYNFIDIKIKIYKFFKLKSNSKFICFNDLKHPIQLELKFYKPHIKPKSFFFNNKNLLTFTKLN